MGTQAHRHTATDTQAYRHGQTDTVKTKIHVCGTQTYRNS